MTSPQEPEDTIEVVMIEPVRRWFEEELHRRGLHLFRIPGTPSDQLPAYAVGIGRKNPPGTNQADHHL